MSGSYCPAPDEIIAALGPAQAVLYGRIWRYCQGGGTCYASIARLADECGISTATAKRWIASLAAGGWIVHVSGKCEGKTGRIATTRKWVMGCDGVAQNELGGSSERARGVAQKEPRLIEVEDRKKDRIPSPRSVAPKPKGATRAPRPLFDAFKGSFPTAPDSVAGRFNAECSRLGYTTSQWSEFMADRETVDQLRRGFITRNNALDKFSRWCINGATGKPASVTTPTGAPSDWRDLVYTHDGTRRAPALILPRIGLDRFASPAEWPLWLREFEGVTA